MSFACSGTVAFGSGAPWIEVIDDDGLAPYEQTFRA